MKGSGVYMGTFSLKSIFMAIVTFLCDNLLAVSTAHWSHRTRLPFCHDIESSGFLREGIPWQRSGVKPSHSFLY